MNSTTWPTTPVLGPPTDAYYQKTQTIEDDLFHAEIERLTHSEIAILIFMGIFIATVLIISAWSAFLLLFERPGGGPLGTIVVFLIKSFT